MSRPATCIPICEGDASPSAVRPGCRAEQPHVTRCTCRLSLLSMPLYNWLEAYGSLAAAAAAGIGLGAAAAQLHHGRRTAQGQFLLELDKRFDDYWEVHTALRPGGKWSSHHGPQTGEEWSKVEDYMGLFELLNILMNDKVIKQHHVSLFYLYRLQNIWAHGVIIKTKLGTTEREYWMGFIEISQRFTIPGSSDPDLALLGLPDRGMR